MFGFDLDPLGERPVGEYDRTRFDPLWWVAGYEPRTPQRIGAYGTPLAHHAQWVVANGVQYADSDVSQMPTMERNYLGTVNATTARTAVGRPVPMTRVNRSVGMRKRQLLRHPNTRYGNLPTPAMYQTALFQRDPIRLEQVTPYSEKLAAFAETQRGFGSLAQHRARLENKLLNSRLPPPARKQTEKSLENLALRQDVFFRKKGEIIRKIKQNPAMVYALKADPVIRAELDHNPVFEDLKPYIDQAMYYGSYPNN